MNRFKYCLITAFIVGLSSCTSIVHTPTVAESKARENVRPQHDGKFTSGQDGIYTYKAYVRSVSLTAPSLFQTTQIDVYDMDSDGRFDTVFCLTDGKWEYGSTSELRKQYRMLNPSLGSKEVMGHIKRATNVKWSLRPKKPIEQNSAVPTNTKPTRSTTLKKPTGTPAEVFDPF